MSMHSVAYVKPHMISGSKHLHIPKQVQLPSYQAFKQSSTGCLHLGSQTCLFTYSFVY